jgi:hypothetical protein
MRLMQNKWRLKNLEKELQKADRLHIQKEKNKMDKSIDLGKLQSDLLKAEALAKSASVALTAAITKYDNAAEAKDRAMKKFKEASNAVDTAKRAMVEGARTVASAS